MLLLLLSIAPLLVVTSPYHRFQSNQRITECHCVPLHLCPDDDIALNGHGLLDPRIGSRVCPDPNEICCDKKETVKPPTTSRCGIQGDGRVKSRITSKTSASFGEFPWNLIIQESGGDKETNLYKCGASLIHPRVAITVAHCVASYFEEPERIQVRAGEYDLGSRNEPLPFQENFVEEILVHPDYDALSLKNDIAILILSESFQLDGNVGLICLASSTEVIMENRCTASGWGKDAHNDGKYSPVLKKVQLPIVARTLCLETLRSTRLGPRYNLHKSFICAGGKKGQDSCKGDGGSPLICPLLEESDRFVQIGIVSWGIGCGLEGIPGVYVNVPLYLEWIEEEMTDRDLDTSVFKL
ncbi:Trypsin domain containing protein [Asbolus verrucosus]|uniref:Phenoloxidase-activating factor 2 n=1 Tax=Asbolus verrucosus TaxID=1661398 RepID=A0A482VQN7_ASBVE|nr:Trypsin domain containing protein [Asbolus verrucosus]